MDFFNTLPLSVRYLVFLLFGLLFGYMIESIWDGPDNDKNNPCITMTKDLAGYNWTIDSTGEKNFGVEGNLFASSNPTFRHSIDEYNRSTGGIMPSQMTQAVKISWRLLETVIREMNTANDTFVYFRFGLIDTCSQPPCNGVNKMLTIFAGSNALTNTPIVNGNKGYIYASPDGSTTYCPIVCPDFQ